MLLNGKHPMAMSNTLGQRALLNFCPTCKFPFPLLVFQGSHSLQNILVRGDNQWFKGSFIKHFRTISTLAAFWQQNCRERQHPQLCYSRYVFLMYSKYIMHLPALHIITLALLACLTHRCHVPQQAASHPQPPPVKATPPSVVTKTPIGVWLGASICTGGALERHLQPRLQFLHARFVTLRLFPLFYRQLRHREASTPRSTIWRKDI